MYDIIVFILIVYNYLYKIYYKDLIQKIDDKIINNPNLKLKSFLSESNYNLISNITMINILIFILLISRLIYNYDIEILISLIILVININIDIDINEHRTINIKQEFKLIITILLYINLFLK